MDEKHGAISVEIDTPPNTQESNASDAVAGVKSLLSLIDEDSPGLLTAAPHREQDIEEIGRLNEHESTRRLVAILIRDESPARRVRAAEALRGRVPNAEIVSAVILTSLIPSPTDPADLATQAARSLLEAWRSSPQSLDLAIDNIVSLLIDKGLKKVILIPMKSLTHTPDDRVKAVADQIRAVAEQLPNVEEQREAEIVAIVESVPAEGEAGNYSNQIKAFTGITHALRVRMSQQLEPKLRGFLRDQSPRPNADSKERPEQSKEGVALQKAEFADNVTDGLFRLGIALSWNGLGPCYIGGEYDKRNVRTRYAINQCGGSRLDYVVDWHQAKDLTPEEIEERLNNVALMDAAAPGQPNRLRATRNR